MYNGPALAACDAYLYWDVNDIRFSVKMTYANKGNAKMGQASKEYEKQGETLAVPLHDNIGN